MCRFHIVFIVAITALTSCATSAPSGQAADRAQGASSSEPAGFGETAAEDVVQVETKTVELTGAPEGCVLDERHSNLWHLDCEAEEVRVSRSEFRAPNKEAAELSIDSMVEDVRVSGTELVLRREVALDDAVFGRSFDAKIDGSNATVFVGVRFSEEPYYRTVICRIAADAAVADSDCAELIELLAQHADANRAVGISIYGKSRSFPDSCKLGDRSVFCAQNEMAWLPIPNAEPAQGVEMVYERYEKVMTNRGATARRIENACTFDGRSIPCTEMRFNLPDFAEQSMVVGVLPASDGSVALICNFIPDGTGLPKPCSDVFSAKRAQDQPE